MAYLPSVTEAQHQNGYVIRLSFDDGTEKSVDISQFFKGPVFEPLKEMAVFTTFYIEAGTLSWPNGVDLAPESLYEAEDVQKAA